jgi:hypothetical protein
MSETKSHGTVKKGIAKSCGLVGWVVFLIFGLFALKNGSSAIYWLLPLSGVFLIVALTKPVILEPLNTLWFKFGILLGSIVAPLVMMLVYFLVVTPTGILMRATGKDSLQLKNDPSKTRYWVIRDQNSPQTTSMKRQF